MFTRFICSLSLVCMIVGSSSAQTWPPSKQESIDAALKILTMSKKGYVRLEDVEPSPAILIEPLGWKGFAHSDKMSFARISASFVYGYGEEKHKEFMFVFIRDMTTHDVLALADLKTGKIEIKK